MRFFLVVLPRALIVFLAFWLVRGLLRAFNRPKSRPRQVLDHLRRDPNCGTFVAEAISWKVQVGGEVLHFCSQGCRDAYTRVTPRIAV